MNSSEFFNQIAKAFAPVGTLAIGHDKGTFATGGDELGDCISLGGESRLCPECMDWLHD